jgi:hypothetical protein
MWGPERSRFMDSSQGRLARRRVVLNRKLGVAVGWLEGTTLFERSGWRIRNVDLASVWRVRLLPNHVGGVYLEAESPERLKAGCHLLVLGLAGERHLSADALDSVNNALAQSGAPSAPAVCERLREQARYLHTGQGISGSPLRTHSEWVPGGLGIPQQEVAPPHSSPYETVRRDDPKAPNDGIR